MFLTTVYSNVTSAFKYHKRNFLRYTLTEKMNRKKDFLPSKEQFATTARPILWLFHAHWLQICTSSWWSNFFCCNSWTAFKGWFNRICLFPYHCCNPKSYIDCLHVVLTPRSPDLIKIGHVWNIIWRQLQQNQDSTFTVPVLTNQV